MAVTHCEPVWSRENLDDPHGVRDKARRVKAMFGAIAPRYDLNNRLHSLGQDQTWRRRAVAAAAVGPGEVVLDVACGTGDLAIAFSRGPAGRVIGVDFAFEMLAVAQHKKPSTGRTPLAYQAGDATRLPVGDASVDVVSIAFGLRNVADPGAAVAEFHRVLRPGGRLVILEFSRPTNPVLRSLYDFYFQRVMPRTAAIIAGDRSGAYQYLPRSVSTFLTRQATMELMRSHGFTAAESRPLTLGIAVVYRGVKPAC